MYLISYLNAYVRMPHREVSVLDCGRVDASLGVVRRPLLQQRIHPEYADQQAEQGDLKIRQAS